MSDKFKTNPFVEQTLISSPNPLCSSSMIERRNRRNTLDIDDLPQRLSEANSSLGILSLKDSFSPRASLNINAILDEQRSLALSAIERANSRVAQIPSRLLKPANISSDETSFNTKYINSESTISESDLLQSSTPRPSSNTLDLNELKGRHSISQSLARLSHISKTADMNTLMKNFNDFINPNTVDGSFGSDFYKPGEEIEKELLAEEMSWKREKNIPAEIKEFTIDQIPNKDISMEAFFRGRSEECSNLVSESFHNAEAPIALIDESSNVVLNEKSTSNTLREQNDSLSISSIQRILSETKNSPGRALDLFLDTKTKNNKANSMKELADPFRKPREVANKSRVSQVSNLNSTKEEMKENLEFNEKSMGSLRSSSSLSNLPDGKLPIETTKSDLIWGCVKLGKSASQDFMIRNKSRSRIRFYIIIENPAFKVICESDFNNSSVLVLHPNELKRITVIFTPTKIGAAVCKLQFEAHNSSAVSTKQFVRLFGYGGAANIAINTITRDPTGKFLLSLGNLQCCDIIRKKFILKNEGVLPAFAILSYTSPGFYQVTSISIVPDKVVILPSKQAEIYITYTPKKEDYEYLKSKLNFTIADFGKLNLIHGSEIDRGRLRKVCNRFSSKGLEIPLNASSLIQTFPGESMPHDLRDFKESSGTLREILKLFNTKEIVVYFEHDMEQTLTANFQDETALFQSLYENDTRVAEATFCSEDCTVEPSKILLTPPSKDSDLIVLSNNSKKELYFEASAKPEGLTIKPLSGIIKPDEKLSVNVKYDFKAYKQNAFVVKIFVDDEVHEVNVKVLALTKG